MHKITLAVVVSILVVALLHAADTDLSWVAQIAGFKAGVQTRIPQGIKIVYTISNPDAMQLLRQGLVKRGWTIENSGTTDETAPFIQMLKATSGTAHLKVSYLGSPDSASIVMLITGADADAPAKAKTPTEPPQTIETTRKADIVIDDNSLVKNYVCEGNALKVKGSDCHIMLKGHCSAVELPGDNNSVTVEGTVDRIETLGNGNTVFWQASQEPQPQIDNPGTGNTLEAR